MILFAFVKNEFEKSFFDSDDDDDNDYDNDNRNNDETKTNEKNVSDDINEKKRWFSEKRLNRKLCNDRNRWGKINEIRDENKWKEFFNF